MPKEIRVGNAPVQQKQVQQSSRPRKQSFVSKMLDVVKEDIHNFVFRKRLLIEPEPEGWEEYKRFCELAKGNR